MYAQEASQLRYCIARVPSYARRCVLAPLLTPCQCVALVVETPFPRLQQGDLVKYGSPAVQGWGSGP